MRIEVVSPLRLPLGGGGTDLPSYYARRGGFVVAAALRDCVRVSLQATRAALAHSPLTEGRVATAGAGGNPWLEEALRHLRPPGGLEVRVRSQVPPGSGLGGSGAVLVGLCHALRLWRGERPSPRALAEEAFRVERSLMGRPVGKQDHYVAAYGGVLELSIEPGGRVAVRRLRLAREVRRRLERSLLLADTGGRRDAARALAEQERAAGSPGHPALERLDEVRKIGRRASFLLRRGRLALLGGLFRRHWELKRRLSSSVATAAAERCLEVGRAAGARGGKLIGAGGGGFVLLDCGPRRRHVELALAEAGFAARRVALDPCGSRPALTQGGSEEAA